MPIELRREREEAEGVLSMSRLLMMDDLWTEYLDHADQKEVERDLPELHALVSDMREGLAVVRQHVRSIAEQLQTANDEDVLCALDELIKDSGDDWTTVRDSFVNDLSDLGLRRSLIAACVYVDRLTDQEADRLAKKLSRLRSGAVEPGDFEHLMDCALELAAIGGCVAWCVSGKVGCILGGIQGGIALLALIRRWKKSACHTAGHELADWLRVHGVRIA
jgi:hypothetical protein